MSRYIEYDKLSGRILSEITSDVLPEASEGCGLLEVTGDSELDTTIYGVRGGQLVRLYETAEERTERERLRKERANEVRQRLRSMIYELGIAILEDDAVAVAELRKEYKELKGYMR